MKFKGLRLAVAIALLASFAFGKNKKTTDAPPPQPTDPAAKVSAMLSAAVNTKYEFSSSEKKKLGDSYKGVMRCNSNGHSYYVSTTQWCNQASVRISELFGTKDQRYVLSLQRACAMRDNRSDYGDRESENLSFYCAKLGAYYATEGNQKLALDIWQFADGCKMAGKFDAELGPPCLKKASELYRYLSDTQNEARVVGDICNRYSLPSYCERSQQLGNPVDMAAVNEQHQERLEAEEEDQEEQRQERAEQHRQSEARFNAVVGAPQSMPGGNDPNAIINAARQPSATQQPTSVRQVTPVMPVAQVTNTSMGSSPSTAGPSSTNENCPSSTVFRDLGVACNPVRNMQACVSIVSSGWAGSPATQNYGALTVTYANNCVQPIRLLAKGADDPNTDGELVTVEAGKQFTFSDMQHGNHFFFNADDGTDCFGNNARPGCASLGKNQ
jgi:hypothetical protein